MFAILHFKARKSKIHLPIFKTFSLSIIAVHYFPMQKRPKTVFKISLSVMVPVS